MYFKLKKGTGNHTQRNKKGELVTYTSAGGEVIESDIDLTKKYPEKFEKVEIPGIEVSKKEVEEAAKKGAEGIADPNKEDEDNFDEDEEDEREPLGKDVTSKFPIAKEQDFKVFYKKGKGFFVTEADDEFTALNKKGLKKVDVESFIEEQLEDE